MVFLDNSNWNLMSEPINNDEIPEKRTTSVHTVITEQLDLFNRYSCLTKLIRITAYIFRFYYNSKLSKDKRSLGILSMSEYDGAFKFLIKLSQQQAFSSEYNCLLKNRPLPSKSKLLCLNPFLDKEGIIRVGGRIRNSDYQFDKKHPIILCPKHKLTTLIMRYEHLKLYHCGPQHLLASIREKFWPLSGRGIARKITRGCIICFKNKPMTEQYQMGNLPHQRLSQFSVFSNVGIDYAGPILIKDRKLRGAKLIKSYICLFVCMSTKAVHIDLVTDLSTDSFLQVLKRFIARRGKPNNFYSDNGTQFVGANSKLKEFFGFLNSSSDTIAVHLLEDRVGWHFSPARSPNFGGLWEAGIKSVKHHLKRVTGNLQLNYEDMLTVLLQIESILNSAL